MLAENTLSWQPLAQEICLPRPEDFPQAPVAPPRPASEAAGSHAADRALAEACRSGNLSAYEQLYQTHGAKMKSIAHNLLGNASDAEDAVQEVFLKIHRSVKHFQGESSFWTWIYRILINSCYDMMRKKKRRQETPELDLEPEARPEPAIKSDHAMRLALERYVAGLAPNYRKVFLLAEVEGFSHAEIAEMIGITVTSSKNLLYQAKRRLRQMLLESGRVGRVGAP